MEIAYVLNIVYYTQLSFGLLYFVKAFVFKKENRQTSHNHVPISAEDLHGAVMHLRGL